MKNQNNGKIETVRVEEINIINPRVRDKRRFMMIVDNIEKIGLKKPITVCPRNSGDGKGRFNLVCGQGRLEAFIALGQDEIPARIIKASKDDCYLMSLSENIARLHRSAKDMVREMAAMKERGDDIDGIVRKTGLSRQYVAGVLSLLEKEEERLLSAVEKGDIPISFAVQIAAADDKEIKGALQDAYEAKILRGAELRKARRIIEDRMSLSKSSSNKKGKRGKRKKISAEAIAKNYRREFERQTRMIMKAKLCKKRLDFIVESMKQLYVDTKFGKVLKAEGLDSLPKYLADQIGLSERKGK
jgi:ParB family chromosome partitioning protein